MAARYSWRQCCVCDAAKAAAAEAAAADPARRLQQRPRSAIRQTGSSPETNKHQAALQKQNGQQGAPQKHNGQQAAPQKQNGRLAQLQQSSQRQAGVCRRRGENLRLWPKICRGCQCGEAERQHQVEECGCQKGTATKWCAGSDSGLVSSSGSSRSAEVRWIAQLNQGCDLCVESHMQAIILPAHTATARRRAALQQSGVSHLLSQAIKQRGRKCNQAAKAAAAGPTPE